MAAKITFLGDLRTQLGSSLTVDQLTSTIIFGSNKIEGMYREDQIYKIGDRVPYIDENGVIRIYECLVDDTIGITPGSDPDYWTEFSILSSISKLQQNIHQNLIVLSHERPLNTKDNKVWIVNKSEDSGTIMDDNYRLIIAQNFIVSTDEPDPMTSDLIWGRVTTRV